MLRKRIVEYACLWTFGGSLYYSIETLFRGFSHISMFILGGICMVFFAIQGQASKWAEALWKQVVRCSIFITCSEFITGVIVNKWLRLKVWDYSDQPLQILGQICLPFTILFSGLAALGIILCGYFLYWFFGEDKPEFHIL